MKKSKINNKKHKTYRQNSKGKNSKQTEKKEIVEAPYPHFRYYKKSGHPALITGECLEDEKKTQEYKYRKVMHSEKDGKRNNEKLYPNPNPKDKNPMYIGKRTRIDEKKYFEDKPLPWKYPKK